MKLLQVLNVFVFLTLLFVTCALSAEEYHFGVEGAFDNLVNNDPELIGCDVQLPARYKVCYVIQSDAVDQNPSPTIGQYNLTSAFIEVGDCRFSQTSMMFGGWEDSRPVDGKDEIAFSVRGPVIDGLEWAIAIWALAPGPSDFVSSEAISPDAPDLALAEVTEFVFDISPVLHSSSPIESWVKDADFCFSVVERFTNLIADIVVLELAPGVSQSLEVKLAGVLDALTDPRGNLNSSAINRMEAFIHEVDAQRDKKITNEDADYLIDAAMQIIESIS